MISEHGRTFLVVKAFEVKDALDGLAGRSEPWTNAGIALKRISGAIVQEEWKKSAGGKMTKTGAFKSGADALQSLYDGFGKNNPTRQLTFDPKRLAATLAALGEDERKLVSDNLAKATARSEERHAEFRDRRDFGPRARRQGGWAR